ncbi:MAG: GGDEF domain-containing protein [Spirochaetia bacterium]|jgi:diguanylate cyclase (GGDEF)-like protein
MRKKATARTGNKGGRAHAKAPNRAQAPVPSRVKKTGKLALLSKAGLFSQLREAELRTISRYSGYRSFAQGERVFSEGSHREELYLIRNGIVVIRRLAEGGNGEGQDIARFVAGEVFGEMDLLDTAPRSASAIAEEQTTLLVFPDKVPFQELLEKHPLVFARILRKLLGEIAGRIRAIDKLVSEKSPWIEELKRQLLRDKLSGLYNRAYLEEELPRLVAAGRPVSLLVVKPDNFKTINDTCGHEAGDKTLVLIAEALKSCLTEGDLGIRYRGDEYCAVLPGRAGLEAERIGECIRTAVARIEIAQLTSGAVTSLPASVGACTWPDSAGDARSLISTCFERMLKARGDGGNRVLGESA